MSLRRSARTSAAASSATSSPAPASPAVPANTSKKRSRKVAVAVESTASNGVNSNTNGSMPPPPTTPNKRRRTKQSADAAPPPLTPTPTAVKLMTSQSNYSSGDIDDVPPPPGTPRPVLPHQTNATLLTPRGSKVVAKPLDRANLSPGEPHETTATILDAACAHLIKVDPKLKDVVDKFHCHVFSPAGLAETIDPFRSLTSGICGQQVSGQAAKAIKNRFVALYNEHKAEGEPHDFPTPDVVAKTDIARLRSAGLSQRKAEYIQGLAEKFVSGELSAKKLVEGTDEDVFQMLVAVRGLGPWSVEMFMCFALKRTDIFSTGDLGIQRGIAAYRGRDVAKLRNKAGKWKYMNEKEMIEAAAPFSPYRSIFMWYMWRIEDVDITVMTE